MLTATLAAFALGQTLSSSASVVYPGFPETASDTEIRLVTHSATYQLAKDKVRCDTLSVFKNPTGSVVSLDLSLPVRGKNVQWQQSQGVRFSASMNRSGLGLKAGLIERTPPTSQQKASGIWAGSYHRPYTARLTFKPGQTISIATVFESPIGRAGLDGLQRMVVYDTAGADNWNGSVGQFNYTLKYSSKLVLQVYTAQPEGNWQMSANGAFWKQYDFVPAQKPLLIFTYYPGGFDNIGG